jgi:hypothetical protein
MAAMKKIFWIVLLIVIAYLAWRWWRGGSEQASAADRGQQIFYDRLWVDHLPSTETDTFNIFAAVTEQPIGVFDHRSVWKGDWELFRYEARGDGQAELLFPQSRSKSRITYRAWKCTEKKEFDFCLEVSGAKGPKKYYSQRGWEIGSIDDARFAEERLAHQRPFPHDCNGR